MLPGGGRINLPRLLVAQLSWVGSASMHVHRSCTASFVTAVWDLYDLLIDGDLDDMDDVNYLDELATR